MERDGFGVRIRSERERERGRVIYLQIYKKNDCYYLTLFNLEFFIFHFSKQNFNKKNKTLDKIIVITIININYFMFWKKMLVSN